MSGEEKQLEILWNKVKEIPNEYLSPLKMPDGQTFKSIKAMYVVEMATKQWGPMGLKWGFKELERIIGTTTIVIKGQLWFRKSLISDSGVDENAVIEQYGGAEELFNSDGSPNCYALQSAHTRALTKCLSLLGFGADVYLGKYDNPPHPQKETPQAPPSDNRPPQQGPRAVPKPEASQPAPAQNGESENWSPPRLDGVTYKFVTDENGRPYVLATGSGNAVYNRRTQLKAAGFDFDREKSIWWRYLPEAQAA